MKVDRKPVFDAAKALGVQFPASQEGMRRIDTLDGGIDRMLDTLEVDDRPLFVALRHLFGPLKQGQVDVIKDALNGRAVPAPTPDGISQIGLSDADFRSAANRLGCKVAQIRAVDEVESGGGWFVDVRKDILDLDGPGGFINGPNLPKILFEAHHFDKRTNGRFRNSHPNISSAAWNRALYVGGQGEWARLHAAMRLDRTAALMSASVGRYQIMGFNFKAAGFGSVDAFWDAMMTSEKQHLAAFVTFIVNSGLGDELRMVSGQSADCRPFAKGYNGVGYAKNSYDVKIARAFMRWAKISAA